MKKIFKSTFRVNRTICYAFFGFLMAQYMPVFLSAAPADSSAVNRKTYMDCVAEWNDKELLIRNNRIERKWKILNGLACNISLKDLTTGKEKLLKASTTPSPSPEYEMKEQAITTTITAEEWQPVVVEVKSLKVSIRSTYKTSVLITHFKIYPQTGAISSWLELEGDTLNTSKGNIESTSSGIETVGQTVAYKADLNEMYHLEYVHQMLGEVTLVENTDVNDNLVSVDEYLTTHANSIEKLKSNLFYLQDQFTGDGLMFLKEAPLPSERPVKSEYDLIRYKDQFFAFIGLGAGNSAKRESYPFTTIVYQGGETGRIIALQKYQRNFRWYDPAHDELIWHSTWGDRNRDGRVRESFLLAEMKRNSEIGIDHLYFTDGWQKGPSSNSVNSEKGGMWSNQWSRPDYWTPNLERFPNGFDALINKARSLGFKTGMWYNPDRTNNYANWRKDTDVLLELHRKYGIDYFKYDGISFSTKIGEANIHKAMHRMVQETNGKVSIELDISGGNRPGYFSGMQYGFLFLENRYTDLRRYYPHMTLRNLWQLSHYVDPRRLRMEFLNNERSKDKYPNDPLAPANYSADYLFAVTMFAKPMAWFETTGLSETYAQKLKQIITIYKKHWHAIHQGTILPIGDEPKGFSWTGFQSQKPDSDEGYLVVFRELNENPSVVMALPLLEPGKYRFEHLSGNGKSFNATIGKDKTAQLSLPNKLNYGFYQYRKIK